MKYLTICFLLITSFVLKAQSSQKKDWKDMHLYDKVKSVRSIPYQVKIEKGKPIAKGDIENDDDLLVFRMSNIYNSLKQFSINGNLQTLLLFFKDGSIDIRSEYYYDPEGKCIVNRRNSEKTMFVYNPQGYLIKEVTYTPGGFLKSHTNLEVNDKGEVLKETSFISNELDHTTSFKYNQQSLPVERIDFDKKGELNQKTFFKYNSKGQLTQLRQYNNLNKLVKIAKKSYNNQGDCIVSELHYKENKKKEIESYEYSYDQHHNWISMTIFLDGKPTQIIERTFEYYE